jgi:hypothetical protein
MCDKLDFPFLCDAKKAAEDCRKEVDSRMNYQKRFRPKQNFAIIEAMKGTSEKREKHI